MFASIVRDANAIVLSTEDTLSRADDEEQASGSSATQARPREQVRAHVCLLAHLTFVCTHLKWSRTPYKDERSSL